MNRADNTNLPANNYHPIATFIGLLRLQANETQTWKHGRTAIILTSHGHSQITVKDFLPHEFPYGSIAVLPPNCPYSISAYSPSSHLIYTVDNIADMLEGHQIPSDNQTSSKTDTLPVINIDGLLDGYIQDMERYISDGIDSPMFMQAKTFELMFLLQHYCSHKTQTRLFSLVANKETKFIRDVMENCNHVRSKAELAAAVGLSTSRFGVKFKEVFGTSPYQWLMTRKSEGIYNRLIYSDLSLKQISEEFGFGSVQHFNDFCKKQFGMTPGKLRELYSNHEMVAHHSL